MDHMSKISEIRKEHLSREDGHEAHESMREHHMERAERVLHSQHFPNPKSLDQEY